jgi:hypothetical protein
MACPETGRREEMKIRVDALYALGLWGKYCRLKGKNPEDFDYLEERWLDLVTVPLDLEGEVLNIQKTGGMGE